MKINIIIQNSKSKKKINYLNKNVSDRDSSDERNGNILLISVILSGGSCHVNIVNEKRGIECFFGPFDITVSGERERRKEGVEGRMMGGGEKKGIESRRTKGGRIGGN